MGSTSPALRFCARAALCIAAVGLGFAAARYTDIARHDLTRASAGGDPRLLADKPHYGSLRASVRTTGKPSAAARASRLLRAP